MVGSVIAAATEDAVTDYELRREADRVLTRILRASCVFAVQPTPEERAQLQDELLAFRAQPIAVRPSGIQRAVRSR